MVHDHLAQRRDRARLHLLEARFDPATRRHLSEVGLGPGKTCLEVGPGTGSILRWMAQAVAPGGRVLGLDVSFENLDDSPFVERVVGDIMSYPLGEGAFDLVFARFVLIHIPRFELALEHMVRALRPGGALLVEEADMTAAAPVWAGRTADAVGRVNATIAEVCSRAGLRPHAGRLLPGLVQQLGMERIRVDVDWPLAPGGSDVAALMRISAEHYLQYPVPSAPASRDDFKTYIECSHDPTRWALWFATVSVSAHRPSA